MLKPFSHIYIEKSISTHPRTLEILSKFKNSEIIEIEHYKDVFNRRGQNFRTQKLSQKLILAKRSDHFFYAGSNFSPSFDHPHFYYNTLALNCIYDCAYCYLQGMFSSGNLVFFVNWEDFFAETDHFLKENKFLYLALSYDTDLLATESFFPACSAWIEFARSRPNLLLEIRTKSANYRSIRKYKPIENVILAWTLSPNGIIKQIESKTPSLKNRLQSILQALLDGWKVRICIDPILREPGWKDAYSELVEEIDHSLDLSKLYDISIGSFRMNIDFMSKIQHLRSDTPLLYYPFERKDGIVSYPKQENDEMIEFVKVCFRDLVKEKQIKVSY